MQRTRMCLARRKEKKRRKRSGGRERFASITSLLEVRFQWRPSLDASGIDASVQTHRTSCRSEANTRRSDERRTSHSSSGVQRPAGASTRRAARAAVAAVAAALHVDDGGAAAQQQKIRGLSHVSLLHSRRRWSLHDCLQVHWFAARALLASLAVFHLRMALRVSLVSAHHVAFDLDGIELLSVVHLESVANELGKDGRRAAQRTREANNDHNAQRRERTHRYGRERRAKRGSSNAVEWRRAASAGSGGGCAGSGEARCRSLRRCSPVPAASRSIAHARLLTET